ncbi:D-alanyl-D-alanine carboxypeptidase/D-alanyl-D-alanine-endopeptidase [gut metagenome]|uniref:D-alanyl-D-alanine carboxypeptidase/D-alanyl-D-alanine-endopeptidase n=1 Tax=gut metagenome TaxID=749906 RepID=J9BTH7_9ZZZZ
MDRILFSIVVLMECLPLWGQASFSQIDSLIVKMLPEESSVGIAVYDLTAGRTLYTHQAEKLSRPASTMKLLTAITALSRPEADEPFRTEVWHDGVIERDTLKGNLYVVGGFDPEFDDEAMDSLVSQVVSSSFSVVEGQVYGDVSMKDSLYWGSGWAWDDTPAAFQPYLSPLMFCKGTVEVTVLPSTLQGDTAVVLCHPHSSYYELDNQTRTRVPGAGRLTFTRNWLSNGNRLLVSGNVTGVRKETLNLFDSSAFFMHTFLERLLARGVVVSSTYDYATLPSDSGKVARLACWETSIQQVLNQLMKESDNLNAEALLCRLGAQASEKKWVAAEDGIVEIMKLIRRLGRNPNQYKIADGCGLSNYNYLSPALLVDFLKYAYSHTEVFRKLYKSLPVGGVDGTLKHRMKQAPALRNVHAKTGSFTAINTLAGYLRQKTGHEVAFAIMNQNILSAARARTFQDKVCEVLIGK